MQKRLRNNCLLLALTVVSSSLFAQTRFVDDVFSEVNRTDDVQYATSIDRAGDPQDLHFDLYEPVGDTEAYRPLIIVCSEGSFLRNDKRDEYIVNYANQMARKGYLVASLEYRIGWPLPTPLVSTAEDNARNIVPASWRAIQDFKAAVRFFKKSVAEDGNPYRVDPALIMGGGFGAGAYLPINSQVLDVASEFDLVSMQKKDENTGEPDGSGGYVDTTLVDLGGIYDQSNGSPGYSFDIPVAMVYSGALIDTLMLNTGTNPLVISVHGTLDETTPYKTDIVNAQVGPFDLAPVIEVHGTYQIHRILFDMGQNTYFQNIDSDGFPQVEIPDNNHGPLNMYERGLYSFVGEGYMPWSQEYGEAGTYETYMDTLVTFTAHRLQPYVEENKTVGVRELESLTGSEVRLFPNPAVNYIELVSTFELKSATIYNLQGKAIVSQVLNGNGQKMDVSSLKPGQYTIQVNTVGGKMSQSFVKN